MKDQQEDSVNPITSVERKIQNERKKEGEKKLEAVVRDLVKLKDTLAAKEAEAQDIIEEYNL